jgi:Ring finger domain
MSNESWLADLLSDDDEDESYFDDILNRVYEPEVARSRYGRRLVPTTYMDPVPEPVVPRPPKPVRKALQGGICIRWKRLGQGRCMFADDCPVCLEKKATMRTQCGHVFCSGCIMKVCMVKPVCPYCRESVRGLQVVDRELYEMWKVLSPALKPEMLRIV